MSIQRKKASDQGIKFEAKFVNIYDQQGLSTSIDEDGKHSPIMTTDDQRVMQVLLCLQSNALKFTQKGSVTTIVEVVEKNN